jgi:hypothetical protein
MAGTLTRVGMSAAFAVAGFLSGQAGAMPIDRSDKAALERIDLTAKVAYVYGGADTQLEIRLGADTVMIRTPSRWAAGPGRDRAPDLGAVRGPLVRCVIAASH